MGALTGGARNGWLASALRGGRHKPCRGRRSGSGQPMRIAGWDGDLLRQGVRSDSGASKRSRAHAPRAATGRGGPAATGGAAAVGKRPASGDRGARAPAGSISGYAGERARASSCGYRDSSRAHAVRGMPSAGTGAHPAFEPCPGAQPGGFAAGNDDTLLQRGRIRAGYLQPARCAQGDRLEPGHHCVLKGQPGLRKAPTLVGCTPREPGTHPPAW